ncbi:MAG: prepilin-type N-terminal cleavage/methylation domain-containing protein [Candidatus Omnitrophica bacterium]|nr:prepilin-type N-terminal cleavage/methylation domain-containing protein [Candidatus Omnitrophota bacterium]
MEILYLDKNKKSFTLIELMIVIGILGLVLAAALTGYKKQIEKGQDAKRKRDLSQLRTALEDYHNDRNRYPSQGQMVCGASLSPWIKKIPCEPSGASYFYETDANGSYFRIYTQLANEEDPAIEKVGCQKISQGGCPHNSHYNYGITSGNIDL